MSLFGRLRSLDVYRDIPRELSEQSTSGGVVSFIGLLLVSWLLLSELFLYLSPVSTHQLVIEQPMPRAPSSRPTFDFSSTAPSPSYINDPNLHTPDPTLSVTVHLNITFYAIPCICLGIEVQDLFGSLGSASDRSLLRYATDSTGHVKYDKGVLRLSNNPEDMTHHVGEGCNVFGTMYVESVPGNFHFLPALSYQHLAVFYPQQFINTSHHVHYLYFGDMTRKQVKHERLAIVMDSIHDHERIVEDDDSAAAQDRHLTQVAGRSAGTGPPPPPQHHFSKSFEYYLKIVHTQYSPSPSQTFHTYQYTSHGNDLVIPRQLPAIYFRYDFSPVTVKIEKRRRSFAHFLTDICAVVGGVLTVLKLINTVFRMRATSSSDATKGSPHNERTLAAPVAALPTTHAPAQHNGYASGGLNGHPSPTAFATPFTTSYASSDNAYSGQAAAAIDSKPMLSPTHYPARASFSTGSPPASAVSPSSYGQSPPAHSFGQQAQQPQQQFVYQQQQQQQQNGGGSGVQRQYVGTAQPRKVYGAHDD